MKTKIDNKIKIDDISKLINEPMTILVNKFTEDSAKKFEEDFIKASNTGQEVIPVVIDSYGGYVHSLLSMVATIENSRIPVDTIVRSKAMSCGAVLFTCGRNRYIDKYATVMIHEVASGTFGKVEEMKCDVKESDRLNDIIFELMATNIGKHKNYFKKIIHEKCHADWFLDANEALEHGIAHEIKIPEFKVSVNVNISFD